MAYEPLHHKYRPQTFAELVGQAAIATTLSNALRQQKIAPAYLFTGARGTGKTSSARILAKSLNCLSSENPTAKPCGVCEVCRSIANGSALDVIEIDAASNTGVDNIRELIERSQFAPVQCRYKVYVIDECLTGDTLVLTDQGSVRIDDQQLEGKNVLSYNESTGMWQFKPVLRWLDQGDRQIFTIDTTHGTIRCTGNHLIRTESGWIAAKDLGVGTKILSPVNVDAACSLPNLAAMDASGVLPEGINSKEIPTARKSTIFLPFWKQWNHYVQPVLAGAVNCSKFLLSCSRKGMKSLASSLAGNGILTNQSTDSGRPELPTLSSSLAHYQPRYRASFTEPSWATALSPIPISTADSPDWPGLTAWLNKLGWNTKLSDYQSCGQSLEQHQTKAMANDRFAVVLAIPNSFRSIEPSDLIRPQNKSRWPGLTALHLKDLLGGTWMMALSASAQEVLREFSFIPKAIQPKKTTFWQSGLLNWAIQLNQKATFDRQTRDSIPISQWELKPAGSGCQTSDPIQSPRWTTNLATVKSVRPAGTERVYDIEVEDNHNFVANGLLVHNCHMLSTAAFNALLKTLEEPPDRVVFVLATTDPQRVLPTIISRCQRFDFRRIELTAMVRHLSQIADREAIQITPEAVQLVGQIAQGGLRDAESMLDQLSLLEGEITVERVWDLIGAVPERDLLALVQAIAQNDPTTVIDRVRHLMDRGREPLIVLQNLASFYRDLLIAKTTPDRQDLVAITPATWTAMTQFVQELSFDSILKGQQQLRTSEVQVKNTTQPRLWLEVTILGLLPANQGVAEPSQTVTSIKLAIAPTPATAESISASPLAQPEPILASMPAAAIAPEPTPIPDPIAPDLVPEPTPEVPAISDIPHLPDAAEAESAQPQLNLEQMWQSVIEMLQPPGTQALFKQQGRLLALEATTARIGISSQPLFKMAQMRIANLEAALNQVTQLPIKVSLEVTVIQSTPAPVGEATLPPVPQIPMPGPNERNRVVGGQTNGSFNGGNAYGNSSGNNNGGNNGSSNGSSNGMPAAPAYRVEPVPSVSAPTQPTFTPATSNQSSVSEPLISPTWQEEDMVTRAAKSLAQMFNGQIVSDFEEVPVAAIVEAELNRTPELPELADETETGDPDDDVPF